MDMEAPGIQMRADTIRARKFVKGPDGPVGIESGRAFLWNSSIRQPSYRDNLYVM